MARYIDADKMVAKDNAYTTFPHDLAGCDDADLVRWINDQPTADVVPKSEVEKLKADLIVWKQDRFNLYQRLELYEITRQKVAREIFAEIEKLSNRFMNDKHYIFGDMVWDIAELKKKYTEG